MGVAPERVVRLAKKNLKRVLGAGELFAIGYGDVGSSIYYTLGAVALFALGATPIAMLIAGAVFVCTAMTFAEMSTTFPEPGGSATFSRYAFNDLISFIAGWGLLLDYIVTMAISSFTVVPYIVDSFESLHTPSFPKELIHTLGTCGVIGLLFLVNFFGVKNSGRFSLILSVFTLLTQLGVIVLGGLLVLNLPHVIGQMKIGIAGASWSPDPWQFMKGTAIAMVAYTGIEAIAQLAGETKNPSIAIPRAIKWTVVVILFLNISISSVGLSVLSPQELGTTYLEDPIRGIAVNLPLGGDLIGPWVGLIASIVLLICANAGLIGCSRLIFSMGEHYQVPGILFKLHPRFRTPHISLAVFSLLAIAVILFSGNRMLFLVDLYNFGAQIAFFSAHMALIILRFKNPGLHRPFRAPLNIPLGKKRSIPLTAVIGALASFSVWILVVATKPEGRILGLAWMAIGIAMYFYYRRQKKLPTTGSLRLEEIEIPEYKPMHIKHVLVTARSSGGTDSLQTAFQLAKHYNAKATAVYILEIPQSIPMDAPLAEREKLGELALKRAEAVSREYHLTIDLEMVRSRSVEEAVLKLIEGGEYDLVVLGTDLEEIQHRNNFALQAGRILKEARCRVYICRS